jgi:hypothetical protein
MLSYVKMVQDCTLDAAPHGTRTSEQNKSKIEQGIEHGCMSLCLQIHFLLALPVGTKLLCAHMKQRSQPSSANDSSQDISHCARKTYVNVDLEKFCI